MQFLAFCQSDFQFNQALFEVDFQGYESQPLLLDLSVKSSDFMPVKQQSPLTQGIMIVAVSKIVMRNMGIQ